jgi:acetyl-CoA synthetase
VPSSDLDAYHLQGGAWDSYEQLRKDFSWEVPERFNMAAALVDQWADSDQVAIYAEQPDRRRTITFAELHQQANALADYLADRGIGRADKVGINAPQKPETLVAHLAAWKLGAVSVPTSVLFGDEGLRYRLADAGVDACVIDEANIETFRQIVGEFNLTATLTIDVDSPKPTETDIGTAVATDTPPRERETASTVADEPALIVYTSGTTGQPKGVVHGHRMLLGQLPHFACSFCNLELFDDDVFYAPIEWAWIAMFNFVVPALFYGQPLVAYAGGSFDPEQTYELLERYEVTCFGAPPTALRRMKDVNSPAEQYDIDSVRVVEGGGEALGTDVVQWARDCFGATVHEHYGQTEADVVIGDCTALSPRREGKMGQPLPGHRVAVVDPETAEPVDSGETGELAVRYDGNPVCFLEYWNKPERTAEKIENGWLLTGDLATADADGYFSFEGRKDDVIISAGYRIDPTEIEATLATHEAVADAGVIGVPDETRGEVPKAYVVLSGDTDHSPGSSLSGALREFTRAHLAQYEYPREFVYLDELPTTVTGKTQRKALEDRDA